MDLRKLSRDGLIDVNETSLTTTGKEWVSKNDIGIDDQINRTVSRFKTQTELIDYVYAKYPEFTVRSERIKRKEILNDGGFFTVGYEGRDIDTFLNTIIQNNIKVVVDVRRNPFSNNRSFIKGLLAKYLKCVDIGYVHIPELGIDSKDRKNLVTADDYKKLFDKYRQTLSQKRDFVDQIAKLGEKNRVALLCFERDVNYCHRSIIAEKLRRGGLEVVDL